MLVKDIQPVAQAMDKSFRYIGDQWASDFYLTLELPGIFKELLQNDTVIDPKTGIRMDLLERVELEGGIQLPRPKLEVVDCIYCNLLVE